MRTIPNCFLRGRAPSLLNGRSYSCAPIRKRVRRLQSARALPTTGSKARMTAADSRVILLAGDDRNDTEFFSRALRAGGFLNPLHTVGNGEEAISYLRGDGPHADRAKYP